MKRLTKHLENGEATRSDCNISCDYCFGACGKAQGIADRLAAIEDIMGDDYDLERLKEAVKLIDKLESWCGITILQGVFN